MVSKKNNLLLDVVLFLTLQSMYLFSIFLTRDTKFPFYHSNCFSIHGFKLINAWTLVLVFDQLNSFSRSNGTNSVSVKIKISMSCWSKNSEVTTFFYTSVCHSFKWMCLSYSWWFRTCENLPFPQTGSTSAFVACHGSERCITRPVLSALGLSWLTCGLGFLHVCWARSFLLMMVLVVAVHCSKFFS